MGKPHLTAPYKDRLEDLQAFLEDLRLDGKAEIVPLDDPYGTAVSDRSLEALIVSEETEKIALKINDARVKAGLPLLKIIAINMVPSENCAPISTTKIRQGEIDREGRLLKRPPG
jgi:pantetheine-phosphate adenylyltransferase